MLEIILKFHCLCLQKFQNAFKSTVENDPECYPVVHEVGYINSVTPLQKDTDITNTAL